MLLIYSNHFNWLIWRIHKVNPWRVVLLEIWNSWERFENSTCLLYVGLLTCPDESCVLEFTTIEEVTAHVELAQHVRRLSLVDRAVRHYASEMKNISTYSVRYEEGTEFLPRPSGRAMLVYRTCAFYIHSTLMSWTIQMHIK
jgi:hypothetical protein